MSNIIDEYLNYGYSIYDLSKIVIDIDNEDSDVLF